MDATWFRDKVLLVEAQGSGKVLNEEELEFLVDTRVAKGPVTQMIITHNAAYQANDLDAYDYDCDDFSTAKAVLMANLSRYGSDVLSEEKVYVITALKNDLRKFKGKDIVDNAAQVSNVTTIAPGMYKLDRVTLAPKDKNNRETHMYYLKHTMEQAAILREIVEQAKSLNPLDSASYFACKYVKLIQELLGYVRDTCHDIHKPSKKLVAVTPINKKKIIRRPKVPKTNGSNSKPKIAKSKISNKTKPGYSKHMTRDRSQLTNFIHKFLGTVKFGNNQTAKIIRYGDYQIGNITILSVYYVEGLGHNLFSVGQFCDSDLEVAFRKHTYFLHNLEGDDLLLGSWETNLYTILIRDMMASSPNYLLSKASKTKSWLWHRRLSHLNFGAINHLAKNGLIRVPVIAAPRTIDLADSLVSTSINQDDPSTSIPSTQEQEHSLVISQGCSKHMTRDHSQLTNFIHKFLGTVKFDNNQTVKIIRYGDYQIGNIIILRVYYVEGLGHNLFSVGQFCDSDLEVAFRKHTYFLHNLEGDDLLSGSWETTFIHY
nr:integrase, catalytic region, zinc finger, CCHC-type, peptidase aspartic, catalytic [Tanacetum cinerariifolium]